MWTERGQGLRTGSEHQGRRELVIVPSSGEDAAEILCWEGDVSEERIGGQKSVQGRDRKIYDVNIAPTI